MKFCIPTIGSMIVLTEDWTVNLDGKNDHFRGLSAFTACKFTTTTHKSAWNNSTYETKDVSGDFTFPKGTLFKVEDIEMFSNKQRRYHGGDHIMLSVIDTSLEYESDKVVIKTPTGRVSKKKKDRPRVCFRLVPELFNQLEFEFSI